MRKKKGRAVAGSGAPRWSDKESRYIGEISLGLDDRGKRVRLRLVGPRGDKSEDAFYGLKERLQQVLLKHRPTKRGQVHSRLGLADYLEQWMVSKRRTLSEKAALDYEWAIENHLKPGLANVRLRDLDRKQIRAFFDSRATLGDGGKKKVYTVLRAALNDAVDENDPPLLTHNPAARLFKHGNGSREKKPEAKGFWTPEEVKRFLRVARSSPYFPLLLTMLAGALSQAEAFAIRWKDVDLKTGVVSIVADLTEVEGRLVYGETKTEFRRRSFRLPVVALRALRGTHKSNKPPRSSYVFTTPQGSPIRRTTFGARIFGPLVRKAKVTRITPHKLRDNAGSLLIAKGHTPAIVHRVLGHSDFSMTAKKYLHLLDESRDQVAETFNDLFKEFELGDATLV